MVYKIASKTHEGIIETDLNTSSEEKRFENGFLKHMETCKDVYSILKSN
ncbi:hypothetical protein N0B21_20230 [Bacillus velezensis]|nr:hypothetical protein [Bacillus velezensis]MCT6684512.1 hypothetical protein [Bacillus velezensis]HEO2443491.1 hypothetical protein [Streptococcus agalactiae]